jgi:hypothetical protein
VSLGIPFTNPKPLGWSLFEVLTSAQMTAVNANAAAAADGSTWSDVAIVKNWKLYDGSAIWNPNNPFGACFDPISKRWIVLASQLGSLHLSAYRTISGARFDQVGAIDGGNTNGNTQGSIHCNSAGVILAGGQPTSANATKLTKSIDGGSTWTQSAIGPADTLPVTAISYSESLALWMCIIGGASTHDGLFTSPDAAMWTSRYTATTPQYLTVRESPSPIIIANNLAWIPGDPTGYVRSTDAITWTGQTFPDSCSNKGAWSDYWGKFFFGGLTGIWSSPDGTTGSWTRVSSDVGTCSIASFGRMLIKGDGKCSVDGGATWFRCLDAGATDYRFAVGAAGVLAFSSSVHDLHLSQLVGF